VTGTHDVIVRVEIHQCGFEVHGFLLGENGVTADDDAVARSGLVRRRTVHGDNARAVLSANGVGRETLAIVLL